MKNTHLHYDGQWEETLRPYREQKRLLNLSNLSFSVKSNEIEAMCRTKLSVVLEKALWKTPNNSRQHNGWCNLVFESTTDRDTALCELQGLLLLGRWACRIIVRFAFLDSWCMLRQFILEMSV